jgi:hypothetical protein
MRCALSPFLEEATMAANTFGKLLQELGVREEGLSNRSNERHFRVSDDVGLMVLTLAPQKEMSSRRKAYSYEEIPEEPQITPQLSLAELASRAGKATSAAELRRLRREFARFRHPDHCGGASNPVATAEMADANRLIDDAMTSLRTSCPASR